MFLFAVLPLLLLPAIGCLFVAARHPLPTAPKPNMRDGRPASMAACFLPRKQDSPTAETFIAGWRFLRPKAPRCDDVWRDFPRLVARRPGFACFS